MRLSVLCAVAFTLFLLPLRAEETAVVRAADGFQLPVGVNGTGAGYYIARGYRPNGHLGEDWNGIGGGDTDLGDPVYATANGFVMFARNYHVGWGNVVILRHAYYEGSEVKYCDSLYGHLLEFSVHEGEQVRRGQQIGKIGNNFGMYEAHLHFEMRKNLQIGMFRSSFARDFSNYYTPNTFVSEHRACPKGNSMVSIPINTYPPVAPPILAGPHVETPVVGYSTGSFGRSAKIAPLPPLNPVPSLRPGPAPAIAPVTMTKASTPAPTVPAPTPTPKVAPVHTVAAAVTPTPAPAAKASKSTSSTATVAASSPTPGPSAKHSKATAAVSTPTPVAKPSKSTSSTTAVAVASSTPVPTPKRSKSVASVTPAPATAHTKTVAAASTPAPKKGTRTPLAVASAPATPSPNAIPANKARKPSASPTPVPRATVVTTNTPSSNTQTNITSDPILPAPSSTDSAAPIRRTGSSFKVDRFQDLRGAGGF